MTIDPDFDKNNYVYIYYTPNTLPTRQSLSRFHLIGRDSLDFSSEKVVLEVPIDPEVSAHTGGSLAWDKNKNLFLSTGDNTVPFASDGYSPIDETPGRKVYDAQRSAANTNDLRGKVLRIHPEADGSYTVPEGNLFAKGTAGTRPEIYTMGCRNPYRISVDQATGVLYWGEVGPDAGEDGAKGPRGYDEFNQAKKPGNYGWPYFVGHSRPYPRYDFVTKTIHEYFDPKAPVNNSIYNTGLKTLPPTTNPLIWYPYSYYDTFPDLGQGGRCAIAGPVYHYDKANHNKIGLPEYYDKALFIADWMRNWVFAVRLDDTLGYKRMEPFMPLTGNFKRPIDFDISPDGVMYILEYGSVYGADNLDARLVRLEYNSGNRPPKAVLSAKDSVGATPLNVHFDGSKSFDFDEDDVLGYTWNFGDGSPESKETNPDHTYAKNGIYQVTLTVTDPSGEKDSQSMKVEAGNTVPEVQVNVDGNNSFYFAGQQLQYSVDAKDKEDKSIDPQRLEVSLKYMPPEAGSYPALHRQSGALVISPGRSLINSSDCQACHQFNGKSAGPSFMEISARYAGKPGEADRLANKVISGGSGVWGTHEMSAHPQLSPESVNTIVHYILSLTKEKTHEHLPAKGSVALNDAAGKNAGGCYVLTASYTDQGNGVAPLTGSASHILRPARVEAEDADRLYDIHREQNELGSINTQSYFVLKNIDLKGIRQIRYRYSSETEGATLEVHQGSVKGPLISTVDYAATGSWDKYREITAALKDPGGNNDLYFVFRKETGPNRNIGSLDWIEFER
jgi:cytochrome c